MHSNKKMKKLFLILLIAPMVGFGQTAKEYFNSGYNKAEAEDYNGAINDYNKAIGLDPNYSDAYINRAISKYYTNDLNGACEDANKAKSLGLDASKLIQDVCN